MGAVKRAGRRGAFAMPAAALVSLLALSACAPEPLAGWQPPVREPVAGVALIGAVDETGEDAQPEHPEPEDPGRSGEQAVEPDAGDPGGHPGEAGGAGAGGGSSSPVAQPRPSQRELGLYTGRLRNDDIGFAARFVYVPGVPEFNAWVDGKLRAGIAAAGGGYAPQAHPVEAGLAARGCVNGSTSWAAARVLARPETGPAGGKGTAVTCEVTGAFGSLIEVRMRIVTGEGKKIESDSTSVLYADVANGDAVEIVDEWTDAAPGELWRAAVELLRREAGALSTAPLAEPGEDQLALARTALEGARDTEGGGLLVTMPEGLASPELAGLGVERTEQPVEVLVEPAVALSWSNDDYRQLHGNLGAPFTAQVDPVHTVAIDCALIPCVALTYDDGPSDFTRQLLDALSAEQSRATFFMLGRKAETYMATIGRVVAEGHEIGSHTMNHPDLTSLPLPEATAQVLDAAKELARVSGTSVRMFRPPYGAVNAEVIEAVKMPAILWSIDTNDWQAPGAEALFERAVTAADPGDIILFHDTHLETVEAAPKILRGLRDRGFEAVTVTQLFDGRVPEGRVSIR